MTRKEFEKRMDEYTKTGKYIDDVWIPGGHHQEDGSCLGESEGIPEQCCLKDKRTRDFLYGLIKPDTDNPCPHCNGEGKLSVPTVAQPGKRITCAACCGSGKHPAGLRGIPCPICLGEGATDNVAG